MYCFEKMTQKISECIPLKMNDKNNEYSYGQIFEYSSHCGNDASSAHFQAIFDQDSSDRASAATSDMGTYVGEEWHPDFENQNK